MMPLRFINPTFLWIELGCTLFIILLSLLIYIKTKDLFDLTKHKGIFYFRATFLFLAISYFMRILMVLVKLSLEPPMSNTTFFPMFSIIVSYTSTMAILSLFLSTTWKNFKSKKTFFFAHLIAILLSIITFILHEPQLIILIQLIIFLATIIISIYSHKTKNKSKKHNFSNILIIYILLFLFWFISMMPLGSRLKIPYEYILPSQILSVIIFLIIYYKVHKKIK